MYVNGSSVASSTFSNTSGLKTFNQFVLGRQYDGGGNIYSDTYFHGSIDDIKIYNYALSQSEITALYNEPSACCPIASISITGVSGTVCNNALSDCYLHPATLSGVVWSVVGGSLVTYSSSSARVLWTLPGAGRLIATETICGKSFTFNQ